MATATRAGLGDSGMSDGRRLALLTDPFLQRPEPDSTEVVWFTEFAGDAHHVVIGEGVGDMSEADLAAAASSTTTAHGVRVVTAQTARLSRVAEDPDSHLPADRSPRWASHLGRSTDTTQRSLCRQAFGSPIASSVCGGDAVAASAAFAVRGALRPGEPAVIMLTSDHQLQVNTPANIEFAARTIAEQLGPIDARVAEFPLSMGAARRAHELGMMVVLGAALGLPPVTIDVGQPLTASLRRVQHFATGAAERGALALTH